MLWGDVGTRSFGAAEITRRRSIVMTLGLVAVLLAAPVVVVMLAVGHLPLTGLVVSFLLLFGAVWLLVPRTADES